MMYAWQVGIDIVYTVLHLFSQARFVSELSEGRPTPRVMIT